VLIASWTLCNIVVTPGGALRMSGLIVLVLVCPLFGVVEPGMGEIIRQRAFSLLEVVDEGIAEVGAAPTTGGCGADSAKGRLLTTFAL
jgi:hypothetical protein